MKKYWFSGILVIVLFGGAQAEAQQRDRDPGLEEEEDILFVAGLHGDGAALVQFFRNRARFETEPGRLELLVRQMTSDSPREREQAGAELIGLGPLAIPVLRRVAGDLEDPESTVRARRCLKLLAGPDSARLVIAAARMLALHKPPEAAEALLAYLPFADDEQVAREVTVSLTKVARKGKQVVPVLVRALGDAVPARRAAAGVVLCRAGVEDQKPAVGKLLDDPNPGVRLRAALALAESGDAAAVPVLIGLLPVLPADKRRQVEEFLQDLAGIWAPAGPQGEDEIAQRIRRDAWAAWWNNTNGSSLLALVRKHTLTPQEREKVQGLILQLGARSYETRERALSELVHQGRRILPLLRDALKEKDLEIVRRAQKIMRRIEDEPAQRLPLAAIRLLALRRPPGAAEALLAYLPFADEDTLADEVQAGLTVLARHGNPEPLLRALGDADPRLRAAAGNALAQAGKIDAVRKLLTDANLSVRLRVALGLAAAREPLGIDTLIDLLALLPEEQLWQVQEFLSPLAGEKAPEPLADFTPASRKKHQAAWAAWWRDNGSKIDLARLDHSQRLLGLTLIIESGNGNNGRVLEVDRNRKVLWSVENIFFPVDAWVLPGQRVLIAEYNGNKVTERNFKGKILWEKQGFNGSPVNVQRLPNGNTFIATLNQLLEVDRRGKEVLSVNNLGAITAAYKTRKGQIVCLTQNGQCVRLDAAGKQLSAFPSNRNAGWTSGLDLLANGRILITQPNHNKVAEYDDKGKLILEVDAPQVTTATGLPNGHILAASNSMRRVFEIDRRGRVVWEFTDSIPIFRARRR